MGLFVSGRSELAGAAAGGPETRAYAGGLRSTARRQPAAAGFYAQPGRKPERLGRAVRGPVSARAGRPEPAVDRDRRLCGTGSSHYHGLPASATPALLGP